MLHKVLIKLMEREYEFIQRRAEKEGLSVRESVEETVRDWIAAEKVREQEERKAQLPKRCTCREPKRHKDCTYCGTGFFGESVCGVCHEVGIDGKVIRGTERRVCRLHKAA